MDEISEIGLKLETKYDYHAVMVDKRTKNLKKTLPKMKLPRNIVIDRIPPAYAETIIERLFYCNKDSLKWMRRSLEMFPSAGAFLVEEGESLSVTKVLFNLFKSWKTLSHFFINAVTSGCFNITK